MVTRRLPYEQLKEFYPFPQLGLASLEEALLPALPLSVPTLEDCTALLGWYNWHRATYECVQALQSFQSSPHTHQLGQFAQPSASAQPGFPVELSVLLAIGFPLMVSSPDADPGGSVTGGDRAVFVSSVHTHLPL